MTNSESNSPADAQLMNLPSRLGRWLDAGDADDRNGLCEIYSDDAVVTGPRGTISGLDAIAEHVRRHTPADQRSQHMTSDILIDSDENHAVLTVNSLVHYFREGEPPFRVAGLNNRLEAVRTAKGWRLTRLEVRPKWIREYEIT